MLIANSGKKTFQNILTKVTITSKNKELELTAKKTECMVIPIQSDIPVCNILLKGERIKQVGTFKFLGLTITPDAIMWHRNNEKESIYLTYIHQDGVHLQKQKYLSEFTPKLTL